MNIKPIKAESDHREALTGLELVFDALPHTAEADELEILGMLMVDCEDKHCPIVRATAAATISQSPYHPLKHLPPVG